MLVSQVRSPAGHAVLGALFGGAAPQAPVEGDPAAGGEQPLSELPVWLDADQLASIRDNTFFRGAERDAWFAVLGHLRDEAKPLAAEEAVSVGYAQLARQPNAYRGRPVRIAGHVMRVDAETPAPNDLGIETYYRSVFRPVGDQVWPIAVYSLEAPAGLEVGQEISVPATAVGVFFKNQTYRSAAGAGLMPVVLARTVEVRAPPESPSRRRDTAMTSGEMLMIATVAAAVAGLLVVLVLTRQRAVVRGEDTSDGARQLDFGRLEAADDHLREGEER